MTSQADQERERIGQMTQDQARAALRAVKERLDQLERDTRQRALGIEADVRRRRITAP